MKAQKEQLEYGSVANIDRVSALLCSIHILEIYFDTLIQTLKSYFISIELK